MKACRRAEDPVRGRDPVNSGAAVEASATSSMQNKHFAVECETSVDRTRASLPVLSTALRKSSAPSYPVNSCKPFYKIQYSIHAMSVDSGFWMDLELCAHSRPEGLSFIPAEGGHFARLEFS